MELAKYDIHNAIVYFDEKNEYKARPVLIFENDKKYAICSIFAITTKNKQYKYNYKIIKWQEAGLLQPSYIKLSDLKYIEKDLIKDKIGTLDNIDITGIKKMLKIIEIDKEKAIRKYNNISKNILEIPQEVLNQIKNNKNDIKNKKSKLTDEQLKDLKKIEAFNNNNNLNKDNKNVPKK